jgi:hypothetical protein
MSMMAGGPSVHVVFDVILLIFRHSGAGRRTEPGIHNHRASRIAPRLSDGRPFSCLKQEASPDAFTSRQIGLWIPGSPLRGAPE